MKDIILIGAGGHAKSCIDVIEQTNEFSIIGLIDLKEKVGEYVLGYKIIDCDENLSKYIKETCYFLITLGQIKSSKRRSELFSILKKGNAKIATVISPRAYVSKHAEIKEGTIVMHGVLINSGAVVGKNCIINTNALLEHDVKISDNCHISTSSVLNGEAEIGEGSFVGSNSTIVQCVKLPPNSFIKAGVLVK